MVFNFLLIIQYHSLDLGPDNKEGAYFVELIGRVLLDFLMRSSQGRVLGFLVRVGQAFALGDLIH